MIIRLDTFGNHSRQIWTAAKHQQQCPTKVCPVKTVALSMSRLLILGLLIAASAANLTSSPPVISRLLKSPSETSGKGLVTDWIVQQVVNTVLHFYAPTESSNAQCKDHSMQYLEAVKARSWENLWALQMFDSSSKIPDGVLNGNINGLGNFDECLRVMAPDAGLGFFTGKHCYTLIGPATPANDKDPAAEGFRTPLLEEPITIWEIMKHRQDSFRAFAQGKSYSGLDSLAGLPGLRFSLCVPSSCSAADVQEHLTGQLASLGLRATVSDENCHTTNDNPLKSIDWVAISVLIVFGVALISSTAYDILVKNEGSRREYLLAFSVYRNGSRLLDTTVTGNEVLTAVNGIRILSIAWVVYCHRWLGPVAYPSPFLDFGITFISDPARMYIFNGGLAVDSFYLISAMLVCYVFFKEMDRGTSFNWPLYILLRYVRLTPALAMVIFLQASLVDHAGSGPVWSWAQADVEACRVNWWVDLLYVQNYVNHTQMCIPVSWFLAVDMQLYILSPIFLLVLRKWPKYGQILLCVGIVIGIVHSFTAAYVDETAVTSQGDTDYTHKRYTVWLIGMALGYILHCTKKKPIVISQVTVICCWLLTVFLTFGTVYLLAPFYAKGYIYNRFLDALYLGYFRAAYAVGLGWVIYACARGHGGFINTALSWSFFTPLAKLSFCIYLVHMTIQTCMLGSMKVPMYYHDSIVVPQFFADLVMSTGIAAALYLTVEAPFAALANLVFRKGKPSLLSAVKT